MMDKLKKVVIEFFAAKNEDFLPFLGLTHLNIVIYAFTFWMTRPVFPFLSSKLGADSHVFGLLQTSFALFQLIGGPVMGRVCDVYGSKIALQISQIGSMLVFILMGLSQNVTMLFISQLPTLLMHAMHASQSFLTDLTDPDRRTVAMGRLSLSYGIGMILGAPFGGFLSKVVGLSNVSFFAAFITLMIVLVNIWMLPNTRSSSILEPAAKKKKSKKTNDENENNDDENKKKKDEKKSLDLSRVFVLLKTTPSLRIFITFQLIFSVSVGLFQSIFPVILKDILHLAPEHLGFVTSLAGTVGILFNSFGVGLLVEKMGGEAKVLVLIALCSSISLFSFASIHTSEAIISLVCLLSVLGTIFYTISTSSLVSLVEKKDAGTVIGMSHGVRSLVGVATPTVAGLLFSTYGQLGVALGGGGTGLVAFLFIWGGVKSLEILKEREDEEKKKKNGKSE